ncbi:hypothetical protein WJX74_009811 [Apatococcus lobatus]|uniref:Uncharacterized protein n=1 Tax=Apatococcus lobatus TaxID=904363 RepID=A0AAW1Q675_9CHLO
MGILIHDEITLPSGLTVKEAYAGFSLNLITVTPVDDPASPTGKSYTIQAPYNIWVSDDARQAGKDPLMVQQLQFSMGPESLMSGVYVVLYTQMCKQYTSYTNTDIPAPPTAPSSPAPETTTTTTDGSTPASS